MHAECAVLVFLLLSCETGTVQRLLKQVLLKHVSSRLFVALFMSLLLLRLCCLNGASWIHHRSLNLDLRLSNRDNNDTFDTLDLRSNLNSVHEKPH